MTKTKDLTWPVGPELDLSEREAKWAPARHLCLVIGPSHTFACGRRVELARVRYTTAGSPATDSLRTIIAANRPRGSRARLVWVKRGRDDTWSRVTTQAQELPDGWAAQAQGASSAAEDEMAARRAALVAQVGERAAARERAAQDLIDRYGTCTPAAPAELNATIGTYDGVKRVTIKHPDRTLVGRYWPTSGLLTLEDEAQRGNAENALRALGVDVATTHPEADLPTAPVLPGKLQVWPHTCVVKLSHPDLGTATVARYDRDTQTLWTVAQAFAEPTANLLTRHGLATSHTVVTTEPSDLIAQNWDSEQVGHMDFDSDRWWPLRPPVELVNRLEQLIDDGWLARRRLASAVLDEMPDYAAQSLQEMNADRTRPTQINPQSLHTGVWPFDTQIGLLKTHQSVPLPPEAEQLWVQAMEHTAAHAPLVVAARLVLAGSGAEKPTENLDMGTLAKQWPAGWLTVPEQAGPIVQGGRRFTVEFPWLPMELHKRRSHLMNLAVEVLRRFGGPSEIDVAQVSECRMCGAVFAVAFLQLREVLFAGGYDYCNECCTDAQEGALHHILPEFQHRTRSVEWAIGHLAAVGHPVARSAISSQLLAPAGGQRDLEMAAMMCLPQTDRETRWAYVERERRTWTQWLSAAGMLKKDHRPSRGVISTAADGHVCQSLLELHVDDWFTRNDVTHVHEPPYPYHPTLNPNGYRADWQLADGTLVEAAGMLVDPGYAHKLALKLALARELGLRVVVIDDKDLPNLASIFATS